MKKSKLLFVVALLVFALAFVTACRSEEAEETQAGVTPPTAGANGEEEESPLGGIHQPRDLGGRTITVSAWWDNPLQHSAMGWDEPDPATAGNYFVSRMQWENAQRVYREFNINVVANNVDFGYVMEMLTAGVMAGSPHTDIQMVSGGWVLPVVLNELIMPINEVNLPGSDLLGPRIFTRGIGEMLGNVYTFTCAEPNVSGFGMGINLDIINAIGVPNPVTLWENGQWTWDALLNIMRTATADTTGDGIIDRWGIAGQPGDLFFHFIAGNDGMLVCDDFNYALDHPNTVQAIEFMETIFRERLWQYDPVQGRDVGAWDRNFHSWQDGQAATWAAVTWGMNDGNLPFEFAFVPFPTGPANESGNTWGGGFHQGWGFPFGSDWDPAELLMVVEEFFTWFDDDLSLPRDAVLGWPRGVFLTEEDVQRVADVSDQMFMDFGHAVPYYNWVFGNFVNAFAEQEMTAMQAIETFRPGQQEILDNFFR